MFVSTAFVANVIVRDDDTGFGPIVRSTRVTKFDYLIGRFAGAFHLQEPFELRSCGVRREKSVQIVLVQGMTERRQLVPPREFVRVRRKIL